MPSLAETRREHTEELAAVPRVPVGPVTDLSAGGPPARLYLPEGAERPPLLVFFHGGGWVLGDVESYDPVARVLVKASGAALLSVDYRRPPEHPWPAATDDAETALRWALTAGLPVDGTRIGVAGDSAGGQIAAATALRLRDAGVRLAAQVLVYPALDLRAVPPVPSDPLGLASPDSWLELAIRHYVGDNDRTRPDISPLVAPDLSGLPPTVIATAEHDRLAAQGRSYATRLQEAGVPVTTLHGDGLYHGFLGHGHTSPPAAHAVQALGHQIASALA